MDEDSGYIVTATVAFERTRYPKGGGVAIDVVDAAASLDETGTITFAAEVVERRTKGRSGRERAQSVVLEVELTDDEKELLLRELRVQAALLARGLETFVQGGLQ